MNIPKQNPQQPYSITKEKTASTDVLANTTNWFNINYPYIAFFILADYFIKCSLF
jgi:hypothetical protein